jgi:hypothetical protein
MDSINNNLPVALPAGTEVRVHATQGWDGSLEGAGKLMAGGALLGLGTALGALVIGGIASWATGPSAEERALQADDIVRQRSLQEEQLFLMRSNRLAAENTAQAVHLAKQKEDLKRLHAEVAEEARAEKRRAAQAKREAEAKRLAEEAREERILRAFEGRRVPRAITPDPVVKPAPAAKPAAKSYEEMYAEELTAARLRAKARKAAEAQVKAELDAEIEQAAANLGGTPVKSKGLPGPAAQKPTV